MKGLKKWISINEWLEKHSPTMDLISTFCSIAALALSLFVFCNIGNLNDWREHVKSSENSKAAVEEWKEDLSNIRVGYSRQYIEEILGLPQLTEGMRVNSNPYFKTTYTNSYFTLICIYREDSSLLGFLIIGNDDSFNLQNYRCGFSLFEYTINEAEQYCFEHGVQSYIFISNFHSNRLDCNSYYFECNYQHSLGAVSPYFIGYGVCDIGAVESYSEFYNATQSMDLIEGYDDFEEFLTDTKDDDIRNQAINSFLVMEHSMDAEDIVLDLMGGSLGMGRDEFANLQQDYEQCIMSYIMNLENDSSSENED